MNRSARILMVILFLLCSVPSAQAEFTHGWPSITLMGGGYTFDDQPGLTTEPTYGVRIGYEIKGDSLASRLGIEGVYQRVDGEIEGLNADVTVSQARLDILYLYNPLKKWMKLTPFLSLGGGAQFVEFAGDVESDPLIAYGFGVKFPLGESLAFRVDARHVMIFADEQKNEFEYTAGLHYAFGKPKIVRPEKVKRLDSDADGVFDDRDQCQETPVGMKVDRDGCPLNPPDTDDDGVPDYLDKCLGTVAGYPVDGDGCLFDSDGDGVADPFDKCPNNPPGFEVNDEGCMKIK